MANIKWGVLGTADIARSQTIPAMKLAENCDLYAVAGRSLEKARAFQQEFGFEKAYGSYEELLNMGMEVGQAAYQTPQAIQGMWVVYALIPGIGFLLSALILLFYKLKDKDAELMAKCNAGEISREECEEKLSRKY